MSEELLNKQTDRYPIALEKGLIRCQKVIIVSKMISQIGLAVSEEIGCRQTYILPSFFITAKYGLYSLEVYEI